MSLPDRQAWEQALQQRLEALEAAIGARHWPRVTAVAESCLPGLRRAEPEWLRPHESALRRWAAARVRAAWEEHPPGRRLVAVEPAFLEVLDLVPDLTLGDVIDLVPAPPPHLSAFLSCWIRALGDWGGRWQYHQAARRRLLREALRLHLGADGLAALARRSEELEVWLAWLDALRAEGRHEELLPAARRGARTLYWPHHRLQLRLIEGTAAAALGQVDAAHRAWRDVWRTRLCTAGLCMVWEAAGAHAPDFFAEELEAAYAEERPIAPDLQVRIELLCGDADLPLARLQAADRRGWWTERQHPATQVLPFLLRIGTRQAEVDEALLVGRIWRATDLDGRWRPEPPDPVPPGWSQLMDRVIATHPTWLTDAVAWRVSAANALIDLAGAVLTARARGAYLRIAALTVALVEAGVAAGDPNADAPLVAIQRRFPRHKALLREIDALRQHSPQLR